MVRKELIVLLRYGGSTDRTAMPASDWPAFNDALNAADAANTSSATAWWRGNCFKNRAFPSANLLYCTRLKRSVASATG